MINKEVNDFPVRACHDIPDSVKGISVRHKENASRLEAFS